MVDDVRIMIEQLEKIIDNTLINDEIEYRLFKFNNTKEFFAAYNNDFDIIFLDIEIGDNNGVFVSKKLQEMQTNSIIVFVTSYEKYMKKSFGLNVYGYVLKDDMNKDVPLILKQIINSIYFNKTINLPSEDGETLYKLNEIIYATIDNRKVYIKTTLESKQVYISSLKKLYAHFDGDFVFAGSKYIVNLNHILRIVNGVIEFKNDDICIFIPKGKVREITLKYKDFLKKKVTDNFI